MSFLNRSIELFTSLRTRTSTSNLLRGDKYGNLCVVPPTSGLPTQKFLTTTGVSTGIFNINQDYSLTQTDVYYLADDTYALHSVLATISDNAKFLQSDYGAIAGGLTNGIELFLYSAALDFEIPLMSGAKIKANYDWLAFAADTRLTSFEGNPQTLAINFNLTEHYGVPLVMEAGDKFIVRLNDNFSTLVSQTFGLRGTKPLGL